MYSKLRPEKVIKTLKRLNARIEDRFSGRGISDVCKGLTELAELSAVRADKMSRPNIVLRFIVWAIIIAGIGSLIYILRLLHIEEATSNTEIFGFFQGIEAAMNTVVLMGAGIFSLVTMEVRLKRRKTLKYLDDIRGVVHVIDMHQLTKDPNVLLRNGPATPNSPKREMTEFELSRYLDYCSEMLALTSKIAAFYAQTISDPVVINSVNEIEQLTTNLSRKIWQKIILIEKNNDVSSMA